MPKVVKVGKEEWWRKYLNIRIKKVIFILKLLKINNYLDPNLSNQHMRKVIIYYNIFYKNT